MKKLFILIIICFTSAVSAVEPIIFNAIEKSASVYIFNKLAKGLNRRPVSISNHDYPQIHMIPHEVFQLVCCRGITRGHFAPTDENIALLKRFNIKMVFHVRDLRQRIVSFANYHKRLVAQGNQILIQHYEENGFKPTEWTLEDFIDYFINEIPYTVQSIEKWLEVYQSGEALMLITTYEDFVENEDLFFKKILEFYRIPQQNFRPPYIPQNAQVNFRKGSTDEWRNVLTPKQIQQINDLIPEELFAFFNWEY